ncbi:MAG: 30S ribosomal protein S18 [Candidatus Ancaeobacter aquaticus]|nr:30S ribosomal protein S18 [Candidatus Ancaeobacter aquaticus]
MLKTKPRKKSSKFKVFRQKKCKFCVDKIDDVDYKQVSLLKRHMTERGKVMPRRITGNCAYHQRLMTNAIKIARNMALLPYVVK